MDGITVLNVVMTGDIRAEILLYFIFGTIGVLCGVFMLCSGDGSASLVFGGICTLASVILLIMAGVQMKLQVKTPRYECLVDESVSVEELYEKYNVIERRGEIWVLEEKENDE